MSPGYSEVAKDAARRHVNGPAAAILGAPEEADVSLLILSDRVQDRRRQPRHPLNWASDRDTEVANAGGSSWPTTGTVLEQNLLERLRSPSSF
jgi:hypothetical protein